MPVDVPYTFSFDASGRYTYGWLSSAVQAWLSRTGDTTLSARFDDFLAMCERRMWYGYATEDMGNPLRSDPLRIAEMEATDTAFVLNTTGSVAQPDGFLELVSVYNQSTNTPMSIVSQKIIDGYGSQSVGGTNMIAVSGMNFRYKDAPSSNLTVTLRYYTKLTTPNGSTVNDIIATYPDVYLYGCLTEAAIFTQATEEATKYLALYNASVSGLNARTQRITASATPVIRLRRGMVP